MRLGAASVSQSIVADQKPETTANTTRDDYPVEEYLELADPKENGADTQEIADNCHADQEDERKRTDRSTAPARDQPANGAEETEREKQTEHARIHGS